MKTIFILLLLLTTFVFTSFAQDFDVIIKNGMIYDGSGGRRNTENKVFYGASESRKDRQAAGY